MKTVNLIVSGNNLLRESLNIEGLSVNEFSPVTGMGDLEKRIVKDNNSCTILEISAIDILSPEILSTKIKFLNYASKLICFSENITPQVKKFLLKNGISDCVTDILPERIVPYIKTLGIAPESKDGTFLALDESEPQKNIIRSITGRFGYKSLFVSSIDELFLKAKDPDIIMILLNIGITDLDLNGLVRRSYANHDIKRNPVIAYKCMDQGLFVHEIINGLNRLTKVIFSPEELYCMLTDMLFKKEITSFTGSFINTLRYEKYHPYASKTLQQIYYDYHGNSSSMESLFERDKIDSMIITAENIKRALIRAEGIIWLKQANGAISTCGGSGV